MLLSRAAWLVALLPPISTLWAQTNPWPRIQPLMEQRSLIQFPADGSDTPFVVYIRDAGGSPAYKLECHNGDYNDQSEMNFSGDFQCALFALKGTTRTSGNLLAANTKDERSTDWWNRGRMLSNQLQGDCLKYPEYSTARHFRLRGMILTLYFTDTSWSSEGDAQALLRSFVFGVKARPDATARSARAELARGPKAPSSCYP